jgi:hypothetical protein
MAPALTRGRVCNLQCNRWLVRSLGTNNHTLPSYLTLGSLLSPLTARRDYGGGILTHLHTGLEVFGYNSLLNICETFLHGPVVNIYTNSSSTVLSRGPKETTFPILSFTGRCLLLDVIAYLPVVVQRRVFSGLIFHVFSKYPMPEYLFTYWNVKIENWSHLMEQNLILV